MRKRSWNIDDLKSAVDQSHSIRNVIKLLNLVPTGGNYQHVNRIIREYQLNTSHFTGKAWSRGISIHKIPHKPLTDILVLGSSFQSYKLKYRLFKEGLKSEKCELCGWCQISEDGRIPVELDHINGNHLDNRLSNLRILCPNCHSLQSTHRGRNKVKYPKK